MKKLILLSLAITFIFTTHAQLGLLAHAAGNAVARGAAAGSSKIKKIPFTIDTFRYGGYAIAVQRYVPDDLKNLYGRDADQTNIATAIRSFQKELDEMQNCIKNDCDYVARTSDLSTFEREQKYFDYSNYLNEYNSYMHIRKDKMELARKKSEQEAEQRERKRIADDSTFAHEDPNVITDFDRAHSLADNKVGDKIRMIERSEEIKKKDSVQKEWDKQTKIADLERLNYLTKKYGSSVAKKLAAGKVWIGMTDDMVTEEFGECNNVSSTTTASVRIESWIYVPTEFCPECPTLGLMLKNHRVISITQ